MREVDMRLDEAPAKRLGLFQPLDADELAMQRPIHGIEPCELVFGSRIGIVGNIVNRPGEGVVEGDMGSEPR